MAHDLGDMQVDRGPGDAVTTGFATFGGQILANTKAPSETRSGEVYGTAGSWSTYNYGGEFDSGRIKALNGGRFFVDAEQAQIQGYVTYAAMNRVNALTKHVQPLGTHTALTAFAMYNTTDQNTAYFNLGSAHYYGVEAEALLALSHGFSAFANKSWNEARQTSNNQRIANAPDATFAVGAIYENRNFYASLIDKYVGARYSDSGQTRGLDPFSQLDMNLAYTIHRHGAGNGTKFKLNIGNLLGRHEINAFAGYAADGRTPLYYTQAGRSFFGSVAIPFQH